MSIRPNLYKAIFFVAVILYSFSGHSQIDFRDGYVVTHKNDTIKGQIAYQSFYNNSNTCIFKKDDQITYFLPSELEGYGITDYKFFTSGIVKGQFVEFLVQGEISLFRHVNRYIVKKDDDIHYLKREVLESKNIKNSNKWKGVITYLVSDCESINKASISKLSYTEKSLKKIIIKYNNCISEKPQIYKQNKKSIDFTFGASVGVNYSTINAVEIPLSKKYLSENRTSINPKIGLGLYVTSPVFTDKFGIEILLNYSYSSYYSYSSFTETISAYSEIYDSFIDMQTLSIPFAIRYNLLNGNYNLYTTVGVNLDYNLTKSNSYISESRSGNTVSRYIGENDFQINDSNLGLFIGVGLVQNKSLKSGFFLDYTYTPQINKEVDLRLSVSKLSLSFIIYKK